MFAVDDIDDTLARLRKRGAFRYWNKNDQVQPRELALLDIFDWQPVQEAGHPTSSSSRRSPRVTG
jgi:hypothetical protein